MDSLSRLTKSQSTVWLVAHAIYEGPKAQATPSKQPSSVLYRNVGSRE